MDLNNEEVMIKFIDAAVNDAYKHGYRLQLGTHLVNSRFKTVCPIGAVMMTRPRHKLTHSWMKVFMASFDGMVHEEAKKEPTAYNLGRRYRRLLIS